MHLLLLSLLSLLSFITHFHPPLKKASLVDRTNLISANDNMEFSKRGRERKSQSGMERIENSFIPFFFFTIYVHFFFIMTT